MKTSRRQFLSSCIIGLVALPFAGKLLADPKVEPHSYTTHVEGHNTVIVPSKELAAKYGLAVVTTPVYLHNNVPIVVQTRRAPFSVSKLPSQDAVEHALSYVSNSLGWKSVYVIAFAPQLDENLSIGHYNVFVRGAIV